MHARSLFFKNQSSTSSQFSTFQNRTDRTATTKNLVHLYDTIRIQGYKYCRVKDINNNVFQVMLIIVYYVTLTQLNVLIIQNYIH